MVRVHLAGPFREYSGGVADLEAQGATVRALIAELDRRFPGIGEPLGAAAVAINDEIITNATYHPVPDGAEVHFIVAPSGGC